MFAPDHSTPTPPPALAATVGQMVTQMLERRAVIGCCDLTALAAYGWDAETIAAARPYLVPALVASLAAEVVPAARDDAIAEAMAHDIADATRRHGGWDWSLLGAYGPYADRLWQRAVALAEAMPDTVKRRAAEAVAAFSLPFLVGAIVEMADRLMS
jgi:hypothetical protein